MPVFSLSMYPATTIWGPNGMVASGHPLATSAGLATLARGGNAVDAALAMAWVTGVVMPDMCGLGGEAFALVADPHQAPEAWLGSGILPRGFREELLPPGELLPLRGGASVTVPGAVSLYFALHERYGRLEMKTVAEPAVTLARRGFPVDRRLKTSLQDFASVIGADPVVAARFYPEGQALEEGAQVVAPELADALDEVVKSRGQTLYRGALGNAVVEAVKRSGGFLSLEDLAQHRTEKAEPLTLDWQGWTLAVPPAPSAGVVLLEAFGIVDPDTISPRWRESGAEVHRVIEALRLAFADRRGYAGDPAVVNFAAEELLSDSHLAQLRGRIGASALPIPTALTPGDTTSMVAVDGEGRMVSLIHSLALAFGSGVFVKEGGFFLNNRAGRSFNRLPGHPNQAVPGKRPMHTLVPWMVLRGEEPVIAGNTMGGDGQPQWNLMLLLDLLRGQVLPGEAVSLPRLTVMPATDAHTLTQPTVVSLEARFSPEVLGELERRGHRIKVVGPWAGGGSLQVVQRLRGGWAGASDPRGGGQTQGI